MKNRLLPVVGPHRGENGILLCAGRGLVSRMIRLFSLGPISHCALLCDGVVYESTPATGVRSLSFDEWLAGRRDEAIYVRPVEGLDPVLTAEAFQKYAGRPYAYGKAIRAGLLCWIPSALRRRATSPHE